MINLMHLKKLVNKHLELQIEEKSLTLSLQLINS
jgi:hypothetical protein